MKPDHPSTWHPCRTFLPVAHAWSVLCTLLFCVLYWVVTSSASIGSQKQSWVWPLCLLLTLWFFTAALQRPPTAVAPLFTRFHCFKKQAYLLSWFESGVDLSPGFLIVCEEEGKPSCLGQASRHLVLPSLVLWAMSIRTVHVSPQDATGVCSPVWADKDVGLH